MNNKLKYTLGVMVTDRLVYAVLFQASSEGPQPLRRFTRQRTSQVAGAAPGMMGGAAVMGTYGDPAAGMESEEPGADFTIQFGEGTGSNNLFLASEFGGLETAAPGATMATTETVPQVTDFVLELSDILAECNDAGYEDPLVAFAIPSVDISHVELRVPNKKTKRKGGRKEEKEEEAKAGAITAALPGRAQLLALLSEQVQVEVKDECVAFLPMTCSEEGVQRALALFAKGSNDDVSATLQIMRKQRGQRLPSVRLLDTEVSLYLGLARAARRADVSEEEDAPDEQESTLVVRAGAEDTLVIFMKGDVLQHCDILRSLTSQDAPETICSRVLLQQDEHGISEVHRVLLLSEEKENRLRSSFEMFFPGAPVASMRQCMPGTGEKALEAPDATSMVPAAGAALRLLGKEQYEQAFEEVNLLAKQLMRRRVKLPFTWHSLVLGVLLFFTTLFFVARFFTLQQEIASQREELRQHPPEIAETNAQLLQARIDSMQQAYTGYMRALNVLDSLLVGSDRWSRTLERVSREAAVVEGVWVESWRPVDDNLRLAGYATTRDRVVRFADRMRGSIETLNFSEIREWPVYSFSMTIPIENRLPEAATYLRERVATADPREASPNREGASFPVAPTSLEND